MLQAVGLGSGNSKFEDGWNGRYPATETGATPVFSKAGSPDLMNPGGVTAIRKPPLCTQFIGNQRLRSS